MTPTWRSPLKHIATPLAVCLSLLTSIIVSEPSGISNRYLFGATSIMWKPPQSTLPTAALIQGASSTDNTSVHSWTGVLTLVCGTDSGHIASVDCWNWITQFHSYLSQKWCLTHIHTRDKKGIIQRSKTHTLLPSLLFYKWMELSTYRPTMTHSWPSKY